MSRISMLQATGELNRPLEGQKTEKKGEEQAKYQGGPNPSVNSHPDYVPVIICQVFQTTINICENMIIRKQFCHSNAQLFVTCLAL